MKFGIATFVTDEGIRPGPLGRALEERGFDSLFVANAPGALARAGQRDGEEVCRDDQRRETIRAAAHPHPAVRWRCRPHLTGSALRT